MTHRPTRRRYRGDPYAYSGRWPSAPAHVRRDDIATGSLPEGRQRGGGLEYAHYLIPRANDFRPTLAQVASLTIAWLDAGYIPKAGSAALQRIDYTKSIWAEAAKATGSALLKNRIDFKSAPVPLDAATQTELAARDYRLIWPIQTAWTAGLKYALDQMPTARRGTDGPGYNLEIHSLNDYVYVSSELIASFPNVDPAARPVPCKVSGTDIHYVSEPIDRMFDQLGSRIRHTCPTCSTIFKPQERRVSVRDGWTGERRDVAGGATYRFAIVIDCGTDIPEQRPNAVAEFKAICEAAIGQPLYEIGNAY